MLHRGVSGCSFISSGLNGLWESNIPCSRARCTDEHWACHYQVWLCWTTEHLTYRLCGLMGAKVHPNCFMAYLYRLTAGLHPEQHWGDMTQQGSLHVDMGPWPPDKAACARLESE